MQSVKADVLKLWDNNESKEQISATFDNCSIQNATLESERSNLLATWLFQLIDAELQPFLVKADKLNKSVQQETNPFPVSFLQVRQMV